MKDREPRVVIIEDDGDWQSVFSRVLEGMGCLVVGTAVSMETALELVARLGEQQVDAVLLDGNLSQDAHDGSEGKQLAEKIRMEAPGVKIIGVSAENQSYAHGNIGKFPFDKEKMKAVLFPKE